MVQLCVSLRLTEVLVARDGGLGAQQAQHGHHLLALGEGAHWETDSQNDVTSYAGPTLAGREDVAREEDQRVVLLLAVDGREEPGGPAGGLGVPGLDVPAVVEVKQRDLVCSTTWQDSHRVHCGLQSIDGHR